jgi:hypothetical protein
MKPVSLNLKMMKSVAMIISHRPMQKLNRTLLIRTKGKMGKIFQGRHWLICTLPEETVTVTAP